MGDGLNKLFRRFHSLVFRVEHFFSVPVTVWIRGMTPMERFMYHFNLAVGLHASQPAVASAIFTSLLNTDNCQLLPKPWLTGRTARIHYYLGLIAEKDSEKHCHFSTCLNLMPEHYMAKEMFNAIHGQRESR